MAVMEFTVTLPDEFEKYYDGLSANTVQELVDRKLVPVPEESLIFNRLLGLFDVEKLN